MIIEDQLDRGIGRKFAAHDSAEIVISQPMEILATPGYELVGWLPEELRTGKVRSRRKRTRNARTEYFC